MKFGISFSFQAHRALGEPYDKAYREGLELAAEENSGITLKGSTFAARRVGR